MITVCLLPKCNALQCL